jgi:hypothetical protein
MTTFTILYTAPQSNILPTQQNNRSITALAYVISEQSLTMRFTSVDDKVTRIYHCLTKWTVKATTAMLTSHIIHVIIKREII